MQLTLKAWRINSGLTIGDVARKIGKTERTIQNWESGITIPDKSNLDVLAKLYHTDIDFIFLGDNLALSERYQLFKTD